MRTLAKKAFEKQTKLVTGKHKVRPFATISLGKAKGKIPKVEWLLKKKKILQEFSISFKCLKLVFTFAES